MATQARRGNGGPSVADGQPTFRVVVIGAGYAGCVAANRVAHALARRRAQARVEVTVVNPRADFVERIRLHQLAAGSRRAATLPLARVLHPSVRLVVGTALRIDAAQRAVICDGWSLPYDALVFAIGSQPSSTTPGVASHAFLLDLEGANALRLRLSSLPRGGVVTVVGGGLTGIETATEIAERRRDLSVHLVTARPVGGGLSPSGRARVVSTLGRLGVIRHEGATVTEVRDGLVVLGEATLAFDICVWAGPMSVPPLATHSMLATDHLGRLIVDEYLRHPDYPEIIGAGDAVALPEHVGSHLRMSCAAALPLGARAGDAVLAAIDSIDRNTVTPAPAAVGFMMQCISLGREGGVVQLVRADDVPRRLAVSGRPAAVVKELICRWTILSMTMERTLPIAHVGSRGPKRAPSKASEHSRGAGEGENAQ